MSEVDEEHRGGCFPKFQNIFWSRVTLFDFKSYSRKAILYFTEVCHQMKGKREKERYTHLNQEFQRIAKRDKKAFLNDQCKEIEGNNRMRKTRDLFKKIRDAKGTFQAKMGTIKHRNGMDLTET